MRKQFTLPDLGEGINAGLIGKVLVAAGDRIEEDQGVVEVETDKAIVEVPCPFAGVVEKVHVRDGEEAPVGAAILTVNTDTAEGAPTDKEDDATPAPPSTSTTDVSLPPSEAPPASKASIAPTGTHEKEETPVASAKAQSVPVPASPMVRRLAREIGVDIQQVAGTGPGGRITTEDVKAHARAARFTAASGAVPAAEPLPDFSRWGEVERVALGGIRRRTAERLTAAWNAIPHVTQVDEADITRLEELRRRVAPRVEAAGGRLTLSAILVKAVAAALGEFPDLNASIDMAAGELIHKRYYHIGVAVDTERGLLVPVLRDVDRKNVRDLALELGTLAERARAGRLSIEEMQGGTFTLTNLGGIGGTAFTPIINLPQVAILGVSRTRSVAALQPGGEPRQVLPLSLSYDHRAVDGAQAIRFLRRLIEVLEEPFLLILEG